jgi:ribulose-5-phosphate 4-epimerase/fuculose-1-phosphate aldolase
VTIGKTWQQALAIAEEVEEQAAVTYGALLLGGGNRLSGALLAESVSQFASYGQAPLPPEET